MRDIKIILVTFALSLIIGVLIGRISKPIRDCEKCVCTQPNAVIKQFERAKEIEVKKIEHKTDETVKKILIDNDVSVADSILRDYAKRFDNGK